MLSTLTYPSLDPNVISHILLGYLLEPFEIIQQYAKSAKWSVFIPSEGKFVVSLGKKCFLV